VALYAYHNTVHTATGYTPHHLLIGWQPRDLRVSLTLLPASDYPDVDAWLEKRADQMRSAQLSLERMRQAMITARNSSTRAHLYQPDDLVKVSTHVDMQTGNGDLVSITDQVRTNGLDPNTQGMRGLRLEKAHRGAETAAGFRRSRSHDGKGGQGMQAIQTVNGSRGVRGSGTRLARSPCFCACSRALAFLQALLILLLLYLFVSVGKKSLEHTVEESQPMP
jgi:hypothetical protein